MLARPQLLFKQALSVFFLLLMISSSLLPAHFSRRSSGHWVDVCTQQGVTHVWHSDSPQASTTKGSAITAPALNDGLHTQWSFDCPWCLFSLPALSLLIAFWFFMAALRQPLTPQCPVRQSFMPHHWRWPDPRAPPIQLV
ncbi:hypothetical protein DTO96_100625 [Ephemeroptericola cinctiostellae]|uniref:DUF2946 domain-containing protein n=1 Tax=Ephemeroptericola cinctiostellae TaxID=2268024 RepID=A0A345D971_9BURK|nr:DUF2946 family protein [Ephemeroptericola cinctiostellae]AXF84909.1 hypothetical protein DTO96_100625 [Ephemeroptericola cinctiostellae]